MRSDRSKRSDRLVLFRAQTSSPKNHPPPDTPHNFKNYLKLSFKYILQEKRYFIVELVKKL